MAFPIFSRIFGGRNKPIDLAAKPEPSAPDRKGIAQRGFYYQDRVVGTLGSDVQEEIFLKVWQVHPGVRRAISKQARLACQVDYDIVPNPKAPGEPTVADRAALAEFFSYPNRDDDFSSIVYQTIARLKLTGKAAWEVVWKDGTPRDFYFLGGLVSPLVNKHGQIDDPQKAYEQKMGAGTESAVFAENEVIYFRIPDVVKGGLNGASDIQALQDDIASDLFTSKWWRMFFRNNATKRIAYILPKGISIEEAERSREIIKSEHQGIQRAHQPAMVLENEVQLQGLDFTPKELGFLDEKKYLQSEILNAIGVPQPDQDTEDYFYQEVEPLLKIVESRINHFLTVQWGIQGWKFNFKTWRPRDPRALARVIQILQKGGMVSVNEARAMVGLPAVEWGNKYLIMTATGLVDVATGTNVGGYPGQAQGQAAMAKGINLKDAPTSPDCLEADVLWQPELRSAVPALTGAMAKAGTSAANAIMAEARNMGQAGTLTEETFQALLDKIPGDLFSSVLYDQLERIYADGMVRTREKLKLSAAEDVALARKTLPRSPEKIISDKGSDLLRNRSVKISTDLVERLKHGDAQGRARLTRTLAKGMKEQKTLPELEEMVRKHFTEIMDWQSHQIANTEIPKAYTDGQVELAEAAGRTKAKVHLGTNPCEWCITNAPFVETVDEWKEYSANHHPNFECSLEIVED